MAFEHNSELPLPERVVPHKRGKLLLDGVIERVPGASGKGFYVVKAPDVDGHFDEIGIFRGVDQVEAAGVLACYVMMEENPGLLPLLTKIEVMKFEVPAFEGDTLELSVEIDDDPEQREDDTFSGFGVVRVDGDTASEGTISGALKPRDKMIRILQRMKDRRQAARQG